MSDYTLHCFARSGNAYKVALSLQVAGPALDAALGRLFQSRRDPPGGLAKPHRSRITEMGEVPVLEHGGRRQSQSGAILAWLAVHTGHFAPQHSEGRYEALRWLLWDSHKFTSHYATLRFLVGLQKSGENPVTEFLRTWPRRPSRSPTSTSRPSPSCSAQGRRSPTSRLQATPSTTSRRASTGRTIRLSPPGANTCARCPAGCIPTP